MALQLLDIAPLRIETRSKAAAEYSLANSSWHLDMLENRLRDRQFVMGTFSLADIPIAAALALLQIVAVMSLLLVLARMQERRAVTQRLVAARDTARRQKYAGPDHRARDDGDTVARIESRR